MFEFQNFEVYKKSKVFHIACNTLLTQRKLDGYVRDQLGRASFSIALNIAEGSAKFSKPDRKNYFSTARGSTFECVTALDILKDQQLINPEEFLALLALAGELSRILYTLIKNLS